MFKVMDLFTVWNLCGETFPFMLYSPKPIQTEVMYVMDARGACMPALIRFELFLLLTWLY